MDDEVIRVNDHIHMVSLEVLCGILVLALLFQSKLVDLLDVPKLRTASTVFVRPELVVEIAIDGLQASTRYPGGIALRFASLDGIDTTAGRVATMITLQRSLATKGGAFGASGADGPVPLG